MTETRVACPRCNQDFLLEVRLVHLNAIVTFCPECNAMWDGVTPRQDNYQQYQIYMEERGRNHPNDPSEIEIIGAIRRV